LGDDAVVLVASAGEKLRGGALAAAQAWLGPTVDRAPPADTVVDAVFGSGLSRPPAGAEAAAIAAINEAQARGARVVAVDVPSGIDSDTGAVYPVHLARADLTVTLHAAKRGLWLYPGAGSAGRIVVASIGLPPAPAERC